MNLNVFKILCEPNQTHLSDTSVQSLHFTTRDTRPREVKGRAMAMPRSDGRAGRARGPRSLNQVQHSTSQLVLQEWKLVGDIWLNQEWLLPYFSHPELFLTATLLLVKLSVVKGRERRPFRSFPAALLSSTDSTTDSSSSSPSPLCQRRLPWVECELTGCQAAVDTRWNIFWSFCPACTGIRKTPHLKRQLSDLSKRHRGSKTKRVLTSEHAAPQSSKSPNKAHWIFPL